MTDTCTRCGQTVGYDCGCTEIERLTAERDCYKARAERAEEAWFEIKGYAETGSDCIFNSCPMCSNTLDILAQIDAEPVSEVYSEHRPVKVSITSDPITRDDERDLMVEPAEPRQPTVQEEERTLLKATPYNEDATEAEKIKLRRTVFRALAEGDSQ